MKIPCPHRHNYRCCVCRCEYNSCGGMVASINKSIPHDVSCPSCGAGRPEILDCENDSCEGTGYITEERKNHGPN